MAKPWRRSRGFRFLLWGLALCLSLGLPLAGAYQALLPEALLAQSSGQAQSGTQETGASSSTAASATSDPGAVVESEDLSTASASHGIFSRALATGPIVFLVLVCLVLTSVVVWAVIFGKWVYLRRLDSSSGKFIKSFWDSRSLNELNGRLGDYSYSPVREIFRSGYAELVKANSLKEQTSSQSLAVKAALDNLSRSINKVKLIERKQLERFMSVLSISASACPFVGLFGTVWGIMNAFEGIARTGNASLSAVAPGISEALIATAFGLAAAIPAAVCYNIFVRKIREQFVTIEGFIADFMNIVERYLVSDRGKGAAMPTSSSPDKL